MIRKEVKRNHYEEIEKLKHQQNQETDRISPHVFGSSSKFAEVDDNGSLMKVEGKYRHVAGEGVIVKPSGYWYLIQAIIRQLPMTDRDRFILVKHTDGYAAKTINT